MAQELAPILARVFALYCKVYWVATLDAMVGCSSFENECSLRSSDRNPPLCRTPSSAHFLSRHTLFRRSQFRMISWFCHVRQADESWSVHSRMSLGANLRRGGDCWVGCTTAWHLFYSETDRAVCHETAYYYYFPVSTFDRTYSPNYVIFRWGLRSVGDDFLKIPTG